MHRGKDLVVGISQDTNELKYIDDVENGKDCNCLCPACKEKLIAKQGDVRKHHFAHLRGRDCEYGQQTSIQYLAKMIIEQKGFFYLPVLSWYEYCLNDHFELEKDIQKKNFGLIQVDNVSVEYISNTKIPDVIIDSDHGRIMLEMYMTHRVTEKSKEMIRENQITTLEVNICDQDDILTKEQLTAILYNKVEMDQRTHYIYCKPLDHKIAQAKENYDQLILKQNLIHSIDSYVRIKRTFQFSSISLYHIREKMFYTLDENQIIRSPYPAMNECETVGEIDSREECWIIQSMITDHNKVNNPYFFQMYNEWNQELKQIRSLEKIKEKYPDEKLCIYHFTKGYFLKIENENYTISSNRNGEFTPTHKPADNYKRIWLLISHVPLEKSKENKKKKTMIQEVNVPVQGQVPKSIYTLWNQGKYKSISVYDVVHYQGLTVDSKNIQTIGKLAPRANEKVWIVRKYIIEKEEL